MEHLGDITKISGCTAPTVDCVIGGSPCQDLSIAGKRAGLDGERSGLFMEQIRIIKEMRERDVRENGRAGVDVRPRYMVWENVPGAFSSNKGEDFRIVLEETAKVANKDAVIPQPDKGKWTTSGCIVGDGWSIAWRILDAQFWGVPQRRRRIALVADFGGQSASEILFVRKSLSGDTEQSESQRKETTSDVTEGFGTNRQSAIAIQGSMIGRADKNGPQGDGINENVCFTLNTTDRHAVAYGISSYHSNAMKSDNPLSGIYVADKSRTLDLNGGNPTCNQGGIIILQPCKCYNIGDRRAVATENDDISPTLTSKMETGGNNTPIVVKDFVFAVDCRNGTENPYVNGTLQAKESGGVSYNLNNVVRINYIVRRLTPLECERLQGFPDGWTDIGEWTDTNGKVKKTSDASRYKALGNSIAIPPWKWVLKRLCACYERDATMASLFDGIGGFPYIWEQLNGKGSCLWASEIEEFPIAVTKRRFNNG